MSSKRRVKRRRRPPPLPPTPDDASSLSSIDGVYDASSLSSIDGVYDVSSLSSIDDARSRDESGDVCLICRDNLVVGEEGISYVRPCRCNHWIHYTCLDLYRESRENRVGQSRDQCEICQYQYQFDRKRKRRDWTECLGMIIKDDNWYYALMFFNYLICSNLYRLDSVLGFGQLVSMCVNPETSGVKNTGLFVVGFVCLIVYLGIVFWLVFGLFFFDVRIIVSKVNSGLSLNIDQQSTRIIAFPKYLLLKYGEKKGYRIIWIVISWMYFTITHLIGFNVLKLWVKNDWGASLLSFVLGQITQFVLVLILGIIYLIVWDIPYHLVYRQLTDSEGKLIRGWSILKSPCIWGLCLLVIWFIFPHGTRYDALFGFEIENLASTDEKKDGLVFSVCLIGSFGYVLLFLFTIVYLFSNRETRYFVWLLKENTSDKWNSLLWIWGSVLTNLMIIVTSHWAGAAMTVYYLIPSGKLKDVSVLHEPNFFGFSLGFLMLGGAVISIVILSLLTYGLFFGLRACCYVETPGQVKSFPGHEEV